MNDEMTDEIFMQWIVDRLRLWGDDPDADFLKKAHAIVKRIPVVQVTDVPCRNPGEWSSPSFLQHQHTANLEAENHALASLLPGVSHGFVHLRAHLDPQAPRKPPPEDLP